MFRAMRLFYLSHPIVFYLILSYLIYSYLSILIYLFLSIYSYLSIYLSIYLSTYLLMGNITHTYIYMYYNIYIWWLPTGLRFLCASLCLQVILLAGLLGLSGDTVYRNRPDTYTHIYIYTYWTIGFWGTFSLVNQCFLFECVWQKSSLLCREVYYNQRESVPFLLNEMWCNKNIIVAIVKEVRLLHIVSVCFSLCHETV
jgi:hypothetical protein